MSSSLGQLGAAFDLARASGIDLSSFREDHVAERVARAIDSEGVAGVGELAELLSADPEARRRFRHSVAMVVTGLFRDPDQFALLEREIIPEILHIRPRLRIWSAGCADGSELYSVGIVLARLGGLDGATLLGSDLLAENLALAERGIYGDVRLPAPLRARMRWEQRDIVREECPIGRWSLVLCRNVAIYFRAEARRKLHERLAGALAPGGVLLLGRAEMLPDPALVGLERVGAHAYRRPS